MEPERNLGLLIIFKGGLESQTINLDAMVHQKLIKTSKKLIRITGREVADDLVITVGSCHGIFSQVLGMSQS